MAFVEVRDVRLFDTGSGGDPPILFCTAQGAIPTIGVSVRGLARAHRFRGCPSGTGTLISARDR